MWLNLRFISLWLKSPQKGAKNYPKPFPTKENTEDSFLTPLLRDLSHSEKLSEIKSPLEIEGNRSFMSDLLTYHCHSD